MAFTETLFPASISQGSGGGASFNTSIVPVKSGFEVRNANWSQARHRYNISMGVNNVDGFELLKNFFMAMNGNLSGFRFKDWGDFKSCGINETPSSLDCVIGTGDGSAVAFQLLKVYTDGLTYQRSIKKPVSGSVIAAIAGLESVNYSVDTTTGIITFDNITKTITGAANQGGGVTRITVAAGHTLTTGDSVYLSGFTGDWAGLNGYRFIITLVSTALFDISFDSSVYAAYSSNAGQFQTKPQTGEEITAGFEFDVPCRFDSDSMQSTYDNFQVFNTDLSVIEIRL